MSAVIAVLMKGHAVQNMLIIIIFIRSVVLEVKCYYSRALQNLKSSALIYFLYLFLYY